MIAPSKSEISIRESYNRDAMNHSQKILSNFLFRFMAQPCHVPVVPKGRMVRGHVDFLRMVNALHRRHEVSSGTGANLKHLRGPIV